VDCGCCDTGTGPNLGPRWSDTLSLARERSTQLFKHIKGSDLLPYGYFRPPRRKKYRADSILQLIQWAVRRVLDAESPRFRDHVRVAVRRSDCRVNFRPRQLAEQYRKGANRDNLSSIRCLTSIQGKSVQRPGWNTVARCRAVRCPHDATIGAISARNIYRPHDSVQNQRGRDRRADEPAGNGGMCDARNIQRAVWWGYIWRTP
jgi:hypothetical protein